MKTLTVVLGPDDQAPWEGQRIEVGFDDFVVTASEPTGDEFVHRYGRLVSRRWLVTLRPSTPDEDAAAMAEEQEWFDRVSRPWWRFGR